MKSVFDLVQDCREFQRVLEVADKCISFVKAGKLIEVDYINDMGIRTELLDFFISDYYTENQEEVCKVLKQYIKTNIKEEPTIFTQYEKLNWAVNVNPIRYFDSVKFGVEIYIAMSYMNNSLHVTMVPTDCTLEDNSKRKLLWQIKTDAIFEF